MWSATGSPSETGTRPEGPIRLLTNLRYFGHCFNPVSFYFCFDRSGETVEAVLADVNNTPWGESHAYVIGNPDAKRIISGRLEKEFHVSPLMAMDHVYEWRTTVPADDLQVHIASHRDGALAFDATLSLERRELIPDDRPPDAGALPGDDRPGGDQDLLAGAAAAAQGSPVAPAPGAVMSVTAELGRRAMFAGLARIRERPARDRRGRAQLRASVPRTSSLRARVEVRDRRAYPWALRGSTGLGEGYVEGLWTSRRPGRPEPDRLPQPRRRSTRCGSGCSR